MTFNKVGLNRINISSKFIYVSLTLAFASMIALPSHARDGKAWGGKCIDASSSGTTVVTCGDGATCSGGGWGGSDCTIGIMADTSKPKTPKTPKIKSADPVVLKGLAPKQPVKK